MKDPEAQPSHEGEEANTDTRDDIFKKEMPKPDPNRKTIIEPLRPL